MSYEPAICIHAAECVRGLPGVFDPQKKPWVNPEGADTQELAEVIERCPTGALKYERLDIDQREEPPAESSITTISNGPLYARGKIKITDEKGEIIAEENRVAFCRCGKSNSKPFCDNTHIKVKFNAE